MKKTSSEWYALTDGSIRILDYDGWDRSNFEFSWNVEPISHQEFFSRLGDSTVELRRSDYEESKGQSGPRVVYSQHIGSGTIDLAPETKGTEAGPSGVRSTETED